MEQEDWCKKESAKNTLVRASGYGAGHIKEWAAPRAQTLRSHLDEQPQRPKESQSLEILNPKDNQRKFSIDHESRYCHSHHIAQTLPIVISSESYRRKHLIKRFSLSILLLILSTPRK